MSKGTSDLIDNSTYGTSTYSVTSYLSKFDNKN